MPAFTWPVQLGGECGQARKQRQLRGARRLRQQQFLVSLRLEVLEQRMLLAADFGDAPAPYPTLLAENGARHEATGPRLGASRDTETNGVHSAAATADGSDENGVTFGALQAGALDATVTVNVQLGAAKLDAWIDFNGDGAWGGPGEQVFAGASVGVGNNSLTFDTPSWAKAGTTIARFRLSTAGGLGPEGSAVDGEVEDYAVTINPPAASNGLFSGAKLVSPAQAASSVFAADVDGDGDQDVLSAAMWDDVIAWSENDGSGNFSPHPISTTADGASSVFAADVDGDGDVDVLSASYDDHKIAWYENDGSEGFSPHTITTTAYSAKSVFAADVDGDGDIDVLSASLLDHKIAWYENSGDQDFTPHTIANDSINPRSVFAADVDGDGDLDVLSASHGTNEVQWYENDGDQDFTPHTISNANNGATAVFAADVDGDGDLDVLSASHTDDKVIWYENNGLQAFTPHTISAAASGAAAVFAADLDGDGDVDVLAALSSATPSVGSKVAWYENDGSQNFTARTVSFATNPVAVFPADVDGDGDLDVLSAVFYSHQVVWYEQKPANNAPVLDNSLSPTLTTIAEDATNPAGTLVSSLLAGAVTDPDPGALRGIAVTSASNFNGTWQFSLDGGGTWRAMGQPSSTAARLLPSNHTARVRFLPKLDFHGTVKFTYRAWDRTQGRPGDKLTTVGNTGGTKSMSTAYENASLTVTAVNDKPVIGLSGTINYAHDTPAITLAPAATVTDVDSANFSGGQLRVRIRDGAGVSNRLAIGSGFTVDRNNNVLQGTTVIGLRTSNGFGTSELIVKFNANATKAVVQQLVRAITFRTVFGSAGTRRVIFTVSDGDGGLSSEVSKFVNVT